MSIGKALSGLEERLGYKFKDCALLENAFEPINVTLSGIVMVVKPMLHKDSDSMAVVPSGITKSVMGKL